MRANPNAYSFLFWTLVLSLFGLGIYGLWVYRLAVRNFANPAQALNILHVSIFSLSVALVSILVRRGLRAFAEWMGRDKHLDSE